MGGGDLNLKKSWHPTTMRNMERVWKAEQKHEAEQKKIEELQKELAEERAREEIRHFAEEQGVLKKKSDRLDWMYEGPSALANKEEYLMGRAVDKTFEVIQQLEAGTSKQEDDTLPESILKPSTGNVTVDLENKIREDPLLVIRKQEEDNKRKLLDNPIRMKQLQQMLRDAGTKTKSKKSKKEKKRKKTKKRKSRSSDTSDESDSHYSSSRKRLSIVRESKQGSWRDHDRRNYDLNSRSEGDQTTLSRTFNDSGGPFRQDKHASQKRRRSSSSGSEERIDKRRHSTPRQIRIHPNGSSSSRRRDNTSKNRRDSSDSDENHRRFKDKNRPTKEHCSRRDSYNLNSREKTRWRSSSSSFSESPQRRDVQLVKDRTSRTFPTSKRNESDLIIKPKSTKMDASERERRLKEMQENAQWREEQRKSKFHRYIEEEKQETLSQIKNAGTDFVTPMLNKVADLGSVAGRIKSNIFNIQRTKADLNTNFAKR